MRKVWRALRTEQSAKASPDKQHPQYQDGGRYQEIFPSPVNDRMLRIAGIVQYFDCLPTLNDGGLNATASRQITI